MDIEKLKAVGIDYQTGLTRFANKTELYEKYLHRFLDDQSYTDLTHFLEIKDYENAFKAAHTLKGVSGNLSMNTLYHATCELVEDLRIQKTDRLDVLYAPVKVEYEKVISALK